MITMLINMLMNGQLKNHPMMAQFNQMMQGKNPQQQVQTIMNMAKSKGLDINTPILTEQQARQLGLK